MKYVSNRESYYVLLLARKPLDFSRLLLSSTAIATMEYFEKSLLFLRGNEHALVNLLLVSYHKFMKMQKEPLLFVFFYAGRVAPIEACVGEGVFFCLVSSVSLLSRCFCSKIDLYSQ